MRDSAGNGRRWGNVNMPFNVPRGRGFTLIEVLVVVAILGLIIAIAVPSMSSARRQARSTVCQTHLHTLGQGWGMYADDNHDTMVPGRLPRHAPGGFANPANHYTISTGLKYRPRWPALMQRYVGVPAIEKPVTYRSRQNYSDPVYVCPSVADWKDERNAAYGYNYQFLGSHRVKGERLRVLSSRTRLKDPGKTVIIADSMGSAAAFSARERREYENNGRDERRRGNYGWLIDPPRLDAKSSRAGGPGSKRSAPDPRHKDKVNVAMADAHVELMSLKDLGYAVTAEGRILDSGEGANNRLFSGGGDDQDPP